MSPYTYRWLPFIILLVWPHKVVAFSVQRVSVAILGAEGKVETLYIYSTYYTRQSGIWPDISRAEGECKYTSEMSGHITR